MYRVDVDLSLSAHANARRLYEKRKHAQAKEQRTLDASEIVSALRTRDIEVCVCSFRVLHLERRHFFPPCSMHFTTYGKFIDSCHRPITHTIAILASRCYLYIFN